MIRLVTLGEIMDEMPLDGMLTLAHRFGSMSRQREDSPGFRDETISEKEVAPAITAVEAMIPMCRHFDLRCTLVSCERLLARLRSTPKPTRGDVDALFEEMESRFRDEMGSTCCLRLDVMGAQRFKQPLEGWESIIGRFRETTTDIEEAQRCLAVERYAAAVFHSCQIMEIGLLELGRFLGVTDPLSGFTAVSRELTRIKDKPHDRRSALEQQHYSWLEQIQAQVEVLKNAWRNKISHAQGRLHLLSPDFKRDVAEEILMATRGFMRRLAEHLPDASNRT